MSVPTGYGKSLIFQMLPFCASFILKRLGKAAGDTPVDSADGERSEALAAFVAAEKLFSLVTGSSAGS